LAETGSISLSEHLSPSSAGDCAAFPHGVEDGHLINKSARPARVLEIGNSDAQDRCVYSDIDMLAVPGSERYCHRDGTPYPPKSG
jgi:uncharacterized cupin superfamily protein